MFKRKKKYNAIIKKFADVTEMKYGEDIVKINISGTKRINIDLYFNCIIKNDKLKIKIERIKSLINRTINDIFYDPNIEKIYGYSQSYLTNITVNVKSIDVQINNEIFTLFHHSNKQYNLLNNSAFLNGDLLDFKSKIKEINLSFNGQTYLFFSKNFFTLFKLEENKLTSLINVLKKQNNSNLKTKIFVLPKEISGDGYLYPKFKISISLPNGIKTSADEIVKNKIKQYGYIINGY